MSKIDRDALFLPVTETRRFWTVATAELGRIVLRRQIDGTALGRFHQGTTGRFA